MFIIPIGFTLLAAGKLVPDLEGTEDSGRLVDVTGIACFGNLPWDFLVFLFFGGSTLLLMLFMLHLPVFGAGLGLVICGLEKGAGTCGTTVKSTSISNMEGASRSIGGGWDDTCAVS